MPYFSSCEQCCNSSCCKYVRIPTHLLLHFILFIECCNTQWNTGMLWYYWTISWHGRTRWSTHIFTGFDTWNCNLNNFIFSLKKKKRERENLKHPHRPKVKLINHFLLYPKPSTAKVQGAWTHMYCQSPSTKEKKITHILISGKC